MAHIPFFYSPDMKHLNEEDTHHFRRVLRKKEGERFLICNGEGEVWWARAKEFKKDNLIFELENLKEKKERKKICLGTAIPKGQRMGFLIEKVCEIGVDKIYPLITKYSSVKEITQGMIRRYNSIARAACMQSEKGFLTKVENPTNLEEILKIFKKIGVLERVSQKENWKEFVKEGEILLTGPEGGWAEEEMETFKKTEALLLPLTEEPLRVETAAIVGLAFYWAQKF